MSLLDRVGFRGRSADADGDALAMLEALDEPAALCEIDGHIGLANRAWRAAVGHASRPPAGAVGLFAAFRAARQTGRGEGELRLGEADRAVIITSVGETRFLLRVAPPPAPSSPPEASSPSLFLAPSLAGPSLAGPSLAGMAPFGAALIRGADPFAGDIVESNPALWDIAGRPQAPGITLGDLIAPVCRAEIDRHLAEATPGPFDISLAAAPGRSAKLHLVPAGAFIAAYLLDVTAQTDLRIQLAQRHRMEAIGHLAGGVAHDFNNLLSAIGMRADDLLLRHPLGDPAYETLAEIRAEVNRAANLILQLLTFSRKATVRRETVNLGEALSNFEVLPRRLLRENMRLKTSYGSDTPLVRVDKAQLEMAVMNLVVNARDALAGASPNGGGIIRLRTAGLGPAEARALGYTAEVQTEMALIEVADDGPGIPPEVIDSIFEPFFTTKAVGEGTGLGLATVYGIVKQSEGAIVAASPPGGGAVFRIFLPAHAPPLTLEPPPAPAPRRPPRDLSGAGRLLFVEDEDHVRDIAARLLRGRGYEVLEACDGEEALELAKANAGRIDLMISDVSMPGMSGPELLKAARPFLGAAPVMFISGYAESDFSDLLEGETGISFLPKPLEIRSLAERVKQQLQAS